MKNAGAGPGIYKRRGVKVRVGKSNVKFISDNFGVRNTERLIRCVNFASVCAVYASSVDKFLNNHNIFLGTYWEY